jgi:hypothetical protein
MTDITPRQKYGRPQGLLFANNPGEVDAETGKYFPTGANGTDFIILSDDNRSGINMTPVRLETRKRMINGRMRSYHIADKLQITTSWEMLPSRSFASGAYTSGEYSYTSDGGAGGVDILDWYETYTGSFWVYLAYDKYTNFTDADKMDRMNQYNEVVEVFFSDFSYSVTKRGTSLHDYWSVDISLEEV